MDRYPYSSSEIFAESRADFIKKTYIHLFLAIVSFTLIEVYLFQTGLAAVITQALLGTTWLLVLGLFMIAGVLASKVANNAESLPAQYAALFGYVLIECIIFCPLLYIANAYAPGAIQSAAQITLLGTAGLTLIAFYTRKDFSFLRSALMWGGFCALGLIVASLIFGFALGTYFSVAMVAFAGAAILYDTSNIIHHYPEDRYVSAALALFASVALMFWYVLQLLMNRD